MRRAAPYALGLAAFVLYAAAASERSLPWGDGAEAAACMRLLAPLHAPGYPLHLLLGRLANAVVGDPVRAAALLSAVAGAAAVAASAAAGRALTGSGAAGAAGALVLALSPQFHEAASTSEVYALHLALLSAAYAVALGPRRARRGDVLGGIEEGPTFDVGRLGLLLGLAAAAHTSTALLLPFFVWYAARRIAPARRRGEILAGLGGLALGLAAFLALRARGASDPLVFQWPAVGSVSDLVATASGGRFRAWVLGVPITAVPARASRLLLQAVVDLSILGVPLAIVGAAALRGRGRAALLVGAGVAVPFFHAVTYAARDPEAALLAAHPALALLVAAGARRVADDLGWAAPRRAGLAAAAAASSAAAALSFSAAPPAVVSSLPRDSAEAIVGGLPAGARLYAHWPAFTAVRYLQTVERRGEALDLWYAEPGGEIATRRADGTSRPDSGPLAATIPPLDRMPVFVSWVDTGLGAFGWVVPEGGAWRLRSVVPAQPVPLPDLPRRDLAPTVGLVRVDRVPLARRGDPFQVTCLWARGETPADIPEIRASLRRVDGTTVYRVPVFPRYARSAPSSWDGAFAYPEMIPLLVPRSAPGGRYDLHLEGPEGVDLLAARLIVR